MKARVISTPIVGSTLAQLALSRSPSPWFTAPPATADEWKARAALVRSSLSQQEWLEPLLPAFGNGGPALDRLRRAARSGIVVTSGQQPGLFGGPLYTWWKALSVLALADEIEKQTGLPCAPVFWAATDDSDFKEASTTVVATAEGAEQIEMPEPEGTGVALAQVRIGDISEQIARLELAAGSAPGSSVLDLVRRSYAPGSTVGGAFVALLRSVVEPLGISVIDAAHPAVRSAAHPILVRALERSEAIHDGLAARVADLKREHYPPQVKIVEGRTLAFSEADGKRDRIRIRDAAQTARSAQPGTLGPNVLLRPIVERSILPTVAYLGGPAEIAYFAQVSAVAEALEVTAPVVLPRWSGYVLEPRVERILQRYSLDASDFADPHAVETRLARASVPETVLENAESIKAEVERAVGQMLSGEGADLVPASVLEGLKRNVAHRIDRLERRYAASIKRRGNDALRDAAIARGALYPFGHPQERALNIIPLLTRYGDDLIHSVLEEAREHARRIT